MSKRIQKFSNRVLAMILAIVMVVGVLPVTAFAETESVVQTNLGDANVIVGEYAEFTAKGAEGCQVSIHENNHSIEQYLKDNLKAGDTVLFKGSRVMKLEEVAKKFK